MSISTATFRSILTTVYSGFYGKAFKRQQNRRNMLYLANFCQNSSRSILDQLQASRRNSFTKKIAMFNLPRRPGVRAGKVIAELLVLQWWKTRRMCLWTLLSCLVFGCFWWGLHCTAYTPHEKCKFPSWKCRWTPTKFSTNETGPFVFIS